MYEFFEGKFENINATTVVVNVGGVGYLLQITLHTFEKIKNLKEGKLYVYFQVREDAHSLYGFFDQYEREVFLQLISVNGVGSATARMALSAIGSDEITSAIINGNLSLIKSIKGIGEKTAQRIILELRDKLSKQKPRGEYTATSGYNSTSEEAILALQALGFARIVAEKAVHKAKSNATEMLNIEDLIKNSLKFL